MTILIVVFFTIRDTEAATLDPLGVTTINCLMPPSLHVREMSAGDLDFAADLTAAEHWLSETRLTFETFLAHDPHGCLVAELNHERIGVCVATAYRRHGFLGELIILPAYRNRGYGETLLRHAMDYLTSRECVSMWLDGDLPAVPLYERLGFRTTCRSLRFLGRVEPRPCGDVVAMTPADLDDLCALDLEAFGDDRTFFLRAKLERFPEYCRALRRDGHLTGYVMAWSGHDVVTVGPWVAHSDEAQPELLLHSLATMTGDLPLRFGVLESNTRAVALLRSISGMKETIPCMRMLRGVDDSLGVSLASLAVGAPATG